MTDTTAPDAITQALHVRFSDDGQHIRKWDRKSFDGSSEYRLAAHGAGEGLRRAFNTAWSEACCHLAPGTGLHTAERDEAWADFARSTPPTDAGSTTREGGCDVEWPEQAIRIAEELEHRVTETRGDSLWCTLCQQDIGADGRQHADTCLLANSVEGSAV